MALDRAEKQSASPAMFRSARLDRLTRTHPAVPVLLYGPIALILAIGSIVAAGWRAGAFILMGYLVWTLSEYWLHRIAFHHVPPGRWGHRLHWMIHGVHHDHPNDARRLVFPPVVSLPVAAAAAWAFQAVLGTQGGGAAAAGFAIGYVVYDTLHHHLHHRRPTTRLGRALRRRHMQHHFRDDSRGFGVSCPYWDYIFGTAHTGRSQPSSASPATPVS